MMNSVKIVKSKLINVRTTKKFADIFKEAQKISDDLGVYQLFEEKERLQDDIKVVNLQNSHTAMLNTTTGSNFIQRLLLLWPF